MLRRALETKKQLIEKANIRILIEQTFSQEDIASYNLENIMAANHVLGFDKDGWDPRGYKHYWLESDKPINNEDFPILLEKWLNPEPERFCTLKEYSEAYPELSQHYPLSQDYIRLWGCVLLWSTKFNFPPKEYNSIY